MTKERKRDRVKGRESVRSTLSADAWWQVNKKLARHLGIEAAIILADLISKYDYHEENGSLNESGDFFYTQIDMEKYTTINKSSQKEALRKLRVSKMIDTYLTGLPKTRYIHLDFDAIAKWFDTPDEDLPSIKKEIREPRSEQTKQKISKGLLELNEKRRLNKGMDTANHNMDTANQPCG